MAVCPRPASRPSSLIVPLLLSVGALGGSAANSLAEACPPASARQTLDRLLTPVSPAAARRAELEAQIRAGGTLAWNETQFPKQDFKHFQPLYLPEGPVREGSLRARVLSLPADYVPLPKGYVISDVSEFFDRDNGFVVTQFVIAHGDRDVAQLRFSFSPDGKIGTPGSYEYRNYYGPTLHNLWMETVPGHRLKGLSSALVTAMDRYTNGAAKYVAATLDHVNHEVFKAGGKTKAAVGQTPLGRALRKLGFEPSGASNHSRSQVTFDRP